MTKTIMREIKDIETPIWKPIPDLPHDASSLGEIRIRKTGRILKPFKSGSYGYLHVNIYRDRWSRVFTVHELVARAFYGLRKRGIDVDHVDGDSQNNRASNLEYVSHLENMRRSKNVKYGEDHHGTFITAADVREIRRMEAAGEITDLRILIKRYGLERKTLYNIRKRITWKHVD